MINTKSYVMRSANWYHLYNLKNVKNTHERVLLSVKSFEKKFPLSKKPECLIFQKFPRFIPKHSLKHQYLLEKSYIHMIPTIRSFGELRI